VEEIGWRLTTIRTFDKRPLYVPNATFTQIAVENPSRMLNRRIFETIGIRYVDVGGITEIVDDVRAMLENHEEIDTKQTLIVNFLKFNSSSLDIMVYTFTKTTQWVKYHEIKQDVLLRISDVIVSHGAEVAFPTRTLHVADSLRIENEEAEARKGRSQRTDTDESRSDESRDQAADKGPVREPSGSGQTTTQGDEAES